MKGDMTGGLNSAIPGVLQMFGNMKGRMKGGLTSVIAGAQGTRHTDTRQQSGTGCNYAPSVKHPFHDRGDLVFFYFFLHDGGYLWSVIWSPHIAISIL